MPKGSTVSVEIESHDRLLVSVVRTRIVTVLIIFVARFGSPSFCVVFAEYRTLIMIIELKWTLTRAGCEWA